MTRMHRVTFHEPHPVVRYILIDNESSTWIEDSTLTENTYDDAATEAYLQEFPCLNWSQP